MALMMDTPFKNPAVFLIKYPPNDFYLALGRQGVTRFCPLLHNMTNVFPRRSVKVIFVLRVQMICKIYMNKTNRLITAAFKQN